MLLRPCGLASGELTRWRQLQLPSAWRPAWQDEVYFEKQAAVCRCRLESMGSPEQAAHMFLENIVAPASSDKAAVLSGASSRWVDDFSLLYTSKALLPIL